MKKSLEKTIVYFPPNLKEALARKVEEENYASVSELVRRIVAEAVA